MSKLDTFGYLSTLSLLPPHIVFSENDAPFSSSADMGLPDDSVDPPVEPSDSILI